MVFPDFMNIFNCKIRTDIRFRNHNYPSLSNNTEGFHISIILYPSKFVIALTPRIVFTFTICLKFHEMIQSHSFIIDTPICWQSSKLFCVSIPISIIFFATFVTSSVISSVVNGISFRQSISCVFLGSEHFSISLNVTVDKYTSYFQSLNISHNCLVSAIFSGTSFCNKWLITDVSKYTFNFRINPPQCNLHVFFSIHHTFFMIYNQYKTLLFPVIAHTNTQKIINNTFVLSYLYTNLHIALGGLPHQYIHIRHLNVFPQLYSSLNSHIIFSPQSYLLD